MRYIWELADVDGTNEKWGTLVTDGSDILILGGTGCTSLKDGHHFDLKTYEEMVEFLNKHSYRLVMAPVNASVLINAGIKSNFNYGDNS